MVFCLTCLRRPRAIGYIAVAQAASHRQVQKKSRAKSCFLHMRAIPVFGSGQRVGTELSFEVNLSQHRIKLVLELTD